MLFPRQSGWVHKMIDDHIGNKLLGQHCFSEDRGALFGIVVSIVPK